MSSCSIVIFCEGFAFLYCSLSFSLQVDNFVLYGFGSPPVLFFQSFGFAG